MLKVSADTEKGERADWRCRFAAKVNARRKRNAATKQELTVFMYAPKMEYGTPLIILRGTRA
jgi:hypothetical protein